MRLGVLQLLLSVGMSLSGCQSGSPTSAGNDAATPSVDFAGVDLAGLDLVGFDLTGFGELTDAGSGDLATPINAVSGTVVDNLSVPLAGFTVAIGSATTTTNAMGQFTLANVTTPYVLVAGGVAPAGRQYPGVSHVMRVDGLTRRDPVITFHTIIEPPLSSRSSTISGTISSAVGLPGAEHLILKITPFALTSLTFSDAVSPTSYSGQQISWRGSATQSSLFVALGSTDAGGYNAFGKLAFSLIDGQTQIVPDIALTTVANAVTTATYTAAPSDSFLLYQCALLVDGMVVYFGSALPSSFPAIITENEPNVPGTLIARDFMLSGPTNYGHALMRGPAGAAIGSVSPRTGSADVAVVGAPDAVARNADFSLTLGTTGAVKLYTFTDIASHADWTAVYTGATTKFPDGTAAGVALPAAGTKLSRRLLEYGDDLVDAAASAGSFARTSMAGPAQPLFYFALTTTFPQFSFAN